MTSFRDDLVALYPRLVRFAFRLTKNVEAAQDLTQDVMLRCITKQHLYKEDTNLIGWASTIMFNQHCSNSRKANRLVYGWNDSEELLAAKGGQESSALTQQVFNAIDSLKDWEAEVIILACMWGFTMEEISEHLGGLSLGTVKSRLHRAKSRLYDILGMESGKDVTYDPIFQSVNDGIRSKTG